MKSNNHKLHNKKKKAAPHVKRLQRQLTPEEIKAKLIKDGLLAAEVGVAQTFWNSLTWDERRKVLFAIGATNQQVQQLHHRGWLWLSLWARKRIKRYGTLEKMRGLLSVQEASVEEEVA